MGKEQIKDFVIFHFRPLESYPPIQNMLQYLKDSSKVGFVYCITTNGLMQRKNFGKKLKLFRFGKVGGNKLYLWFTYFYYNLLGLVFLIYKRPEKLMYYESLSALPVYLYKRFIKKNAKIYIHYHEYATIYDFQRMSKIENFCHYLEKKIYKNVNWISHTNQTRLKKFLNDEGLMYDDEIHHTMPNYPSKSWAKNNKQWQVGEKLKIIYVGHSLTESGSYLKELIHFLNESDCLIEFNIYCMQSNSFMQSFNELKENITLSIHNALPYEMLPGIINLHHIGLILYKARTANYIYNAPNKLFEYLCCGLDVWYPKEMQGVYSYDTTDNPKVLRLDFNSLKDYSLDQMLKKSTTKACHTYFAEDVYVKFLDSIIDQG